MEKKLISVIVTAYNIEKYLPRCMESLVTQTYSPLEIIVVDDGSTDATGAIGDDYAANYCNIKVLHKENGGPSAARNAGVAIAGGSYIGYVDGDDFVEPDMYQAMYEACEDTGADVAICAYQQVYGNAEESHTTGKRIELSKEEALEWYISEKEQYYITHSVWSKLFKRTLIADIRFREGRKSEDIMYTTLALTKADKCVFLDTPYYHYIVNRESSIMNSHIQERRFQDEIPFLREQAAYLEKLGMTDLSEKALYRFYRRMLDYFIDFRKRKMKDSAKTLIRMLIAEKKEVLRIYRKPYVAEGDRIRMKLALKAPGIYYCIVLFYDKFVIPLRQRHLQAE